MQAGPCAVVKSRPHREEHHSTFLWFAVAHQTLVEFVPAPLLEQKECPTTRASCASPDLRLSRIPGTALLNEKKGQGLFSSKL